MSYQLVFVLNFFVVFFLMKITGWLLVRSQRPALLPYLFTTPLLSARVYSGKVFPKDKLSIILSKLVLSVVYVGSIIWFSRNFLEPLDYFRIILIAPMIYIFTEFLGSFGQLVFYFSSKGVPPIHFHPLRACSLGEFWGKRWNFWVRDWLRDVSQFQRRKPLGKLIITFFVSGLFHELLVNLPYYLVYQKSCFGDMTLYFAIQGLGLWLEKKLLLTSSGIVRTLFMWIVVIVPSPLFLNHPLLHFFGIENG